MMSDLRFQNYLLSLLLHQPARPPESWDGFTRFLSQQQLQGLAYRLMANQDGIPADVFHFLEQAYYSTLAMNTLRREHLKILESLLASENISVVLLKGAALLDTVYADPGLRPMEDIDLLVRKEDLSGLKEVLKQNGYKTDHRFPQMFHKDDVRIDVHTSLMHTSRIKSRQALFPVHQRQIFNQSLPWGEEFSLVRVPDEFTHLIYMAHHMIKHSFSKLVWLVDFFLIVRGRDAGFWKSLDDRALLFQQEKPLSYAFFLLGRMFCFQPPGGSRLCHSEMSISGIEQALLGFRSRGRSIGDWGNILWMNCLASRHDKLMLLKETLLPAMIVLGRESAGRNANASGLLFARCRRVIQRSGVNLGVIVKAVAERQAG